MNKTLRVGMLVKVIELSPDFAAIGVKLGQMFLVKEGSYLHKPTLYINVGHIVFVLVHNDELTETADYVAVHTCPVVLPMGIGRVL